MAVALAGAESSGGQTLATLSSVTYNGTSMVLSIDSSGTSTVFQQACSAYLGESSLPGAGSYNVIATWDFGNTDQLLACMSLEGVKDQAPEATAANANTSNVSSGSISVTTLTDNAWLVGAINQGTSGTTFTYTGGTPRADVSAAGSALGVGTVPVASAGATSFAATFSTSRRWAGVVLAFEEAAPSGNTVTVNQAETGDSQTAVIQVPVQISAAQAELGDAQISNIQAVVNISANQVEEGDAQTASIVGVVTSAVTANQTEAGDSQVSNIQVPVNVTANQGEQSDATTGSLSVLVTLQANQTEQGDSQAASLLTTQTASISANQAEAGDVQTATIETIVQLSANQIEAVETQSAVFDVVVNITADQLEAGDVINASIQTQETPNIFGAPVVANNSSSIAISNNSSSIAISNNSKNTRVANNA